MSELGKNVLGAISLPFKVISSKIGELGKTVKTKMSQPFKVLGDKFKSLGGKIGGVISAPFQKLGGMLTKSSKEKKAEKKQKSIFDSLDKLVKKLKAFAANIKTAVLSFIDEIIIPTAKIMAKGIGILLKPIFAFLMGVFWGTGIGILLIGIGIGIGLIGLAVKKLVDWVVDDVGPHIEHWLEVCTPETVNNVMNAAANFINTFSALMCGLFAPIIALGTAIMAAIKPIGEFIGELLTSVKNHLMPIIDAVFDVIEKTVVKILQAIQPIISKIIDVVSGAITTVLNVIEKIIKTIEPIIMKIIDIVGGVVLTILNAIEPIVKAIEPVIMLISEVVSGTISVAVSAIRLVVDGIKLAIQYVRDHWDEFVVFVKSIPNRIWNFIKSLPKMILDGVKKIFQIGKAIGKWYNEKVKLPLMKKLVGVEWGAWKFKWKPFAFLQGHISAAE